MYSRAVSYFTLHQLTTIRKTMQYIQFIENAQLLSSTPLSDHASFNDENTACYYLSLVLTQPKSGVHPYQHGRSNSSPSNSCTGANGNSSQRREVRSELVKIAFCHRKRHTLFMSCRPLRVSKTRLASSPQCHDISGPEEASLEDSSRALEKAAEFLSRVDISVCTDTGSRNCGSGYAPCRRSGRRRSGRRHSASIAPSKQRRRSRSLLRSSNSGHDKSKTTTRTATISSTSEQAAPGIPRGRRTVCGPTPYVSQSVPISQEPVEGTRPIRAALATGKNNTECRMRSVRFVTTEGVERRQKKDEISNSGRGRRYGHATIVSAPSQETFDDENFGYKNEARTNVVDAAQIRSESESINTLSRDVAVKRNGDKESRKDTVRFSMARKDVSDVRTSESAQVHARRGPTSIARRSGRTAEDDGEDENDAKGNCDDCARHVKGSRRVTEIVRFATVEVETKERTENERMRRDERDREKVCRKRDATPFVVRRVQVIHSSLNFDMLPS